MTKPYIFENPSLHGRYRGDSDTIPSHLMNENVERGLQAFREMDKFQYIEFNCGKPTYVFLLEDSCPYTPYEQVTVSVSERGDMKYVFVYHDRHPEERWWIVYQPVDKAGTPISTERCVGWFTDEFSALAEARDLLTRPDRTSRVN